MKMSSSLSSCGNKMRLFVNIVISAINIIILSSSICKGANLFLLTNQRYYASSLHADHHHQPHYHSQNSAIQYSMMNSSSSYRPKKRRRNPIVAVVEPPSHFDNMLNFYKTAISYAKSLSPKNSSASKKIHPQMSDDLDGDGADDIENSDLGSTECPETEYTENGDKSAIKYSTATIKQKPREPPPPPPLHSIIVYHDIHRFEVEGKNVKRFNRANYESELRKADPNRKSSNAKQRKESMMKPKGGVMTKNQLKTLLMFKLSKLKVFHGDTGENASNIRVLYIAMNLIDERGIEIPKKIINMISEAYEQMI